LYRNNPAIADGSPGMGSNCWAVAGKFTESGKPMLSCDPHLMKWLQTKWYLSRLSWGDGFYLAGGSTPGFPLFTYARAKNIAYGATAINPDISDLFVEQVKGETYLYEGEWLPFEIEREIIKVRFGKDEILDLKKTKNGFMVLKQDEDKADFSAFYPLEILNQNELNYSWRWVYSDPKPTQLFAMMKNLVEIVKTGEEALQYF
jgi:penicillin amidase